jgi:hypothetical protein
LFFAKLIQGQVFSQIELPDYIYMHM